MNCETLCWRYCAGADVERRDLVLVSSADLRDMVQTLRCLPDGEW